MPRFRTPRFTIRTLMILVAAVAVTAWVGGAAYRAARDPWRSHHQHIAWRDDVGSVVISDCDGGGFWPVFGRRLRGRPACTRAGVHFALPRTPAGDPIRFPITEELISKAKQAQRDGH